MHETRVASKNAIWFCKPSIIKNVHSWQRKIIPGVLWKLPSFVIFRYGKSNILGIFRLVTKGEHTQLVNLLSYKSWSILHHAWVRRRRLSWWWKSWILNACARLSGCGHQRLNMLWCINPDNIHRNVGDASLLALGCLCCIIV